MSNIEKWLVSRLDTVEAIKGCCYPAAAPVGDVEPPFAIYTLEKEEISRDMEDEDGIRRAKIRLDLFDGDNDHLWELTRQVQTALLCRDLEADDLYIYHAWGDLKDKGFDLRTQVQVQTVEVVAVYWVGAE